MIHKMFTLAKPFWGYTNCLATPPQRISVHKTSSRSRDTGLRAGLFVCLSHLSPFFPIKIARERGREIIKSYNKSAKSLETKHRPIENI